LGYNPPPQTGLAHTHMTAVLLTIHFVVAVAMIGTILLQRSEGGGLGLGGGGGVSGLISGRGAANALTRTTVILATIFIATSIALALMAKQGRNTNPLNATIPSGPAPILPPTGGPLLPGSSPTPGAPAGTAPQPSAPASTPSAIPVPAEPTPAPSGPATPAGAQPAPQPSPPPSPSGGDD
jgi:preprotein translocase subunit SecG